MKIVNPKIILIEDDTSDAVLIREMLDCNKCNHVFKRTDRLSAGLQLLQEESFDVILLDLGLPDSQGLEALRKVQDRVPQVPIIVLTGLSDEELAAKAISLGAQDYLVKGRIESAVLRRSILYSIQRKQAEEALRESEERFRSIFNNTMDGIVLVDATTRKTIMGNRKMCAMLGCTEDELQTMRADDFHPADALPRVMKYLEETARGEISVVYEMPMKRRNGSIFYADISASTLILGGRTHFIGVFRDATERKLAAQELRLSEEKFRRMIETMQEGMLMIDADARVTYANSRIAEMLGRSEKELLVGNLFDYIHEMSRDKARQSFECRKKGIKEVVDIRFTRKDGSSCWGLVTTTPITDTHGQFAGSFSMITDITKRKKAEEALRESEERLRQAIRVSQSGIFDHDHLTDTIYWSPQQREIYGWDPDETVTLQKFLDCVYPEDRERIVAAVRCAHDPAGVGLFDVEYRITRRDGTIRWLAVRSQTFFAGEGSASRKVRTVGAALDITEKHLLEEERLKSQKLESVGTLAGGIAHDFNNLLQGVFGYISLAKISLDRPDQVKAMLEQAEEAVHLSVNLTTQLLTFSKGGKPVKKLIGLQSTIENSVKFALSGSHTDHLLEIATDLWPVDADEGQLAQVIQNIVLNSHDAMAGRGTVRVFTANVNLAKGMNPGLPDGGRFVRIDFQDSGTGIPEQNLAKIFDPYFTTKQRGSGLGLATSYSIIKNHGGVIEVKSEEGKGSTFSIYLPAAEHAEAAVTATITPVSEKKGRVLVMDDQKLVRSVAKKMIVALGHEVECVSDGKEAIEVFRHAREAGNPFDLVILDLTVKGGMGGEEAITMLLEIDPEVVAVVSSGYASNPVVADHRAYGFAAFLNK
ncbi:MAG: PAS domain S-box protein, partial [Thermodesulfovibrionales bacterium]